MRARSGRAGLLRPLAERDFRLLWSGQAVSLVGDGVLTVALAWQTLRLSSSPAALGLVLFARAGPRFLFLLLGGVISDRLPRRRVMLVADLAQALAVGAIALLAAGGELRLWHLVTLGAVAGVASAFFLPASTALLPELLRDDLLLPANALSTSSRVLAAEFAGPALGGLLIAVAGTATAFAVDAGSFVVSVATLAMLRARPQPRPASAPPAGVLREVAEGLAYARSQPWIWATLVVTAFGNFLVSGPLGVLLPVVVSGLGAGAGSLGLTYAAFGVGGRPRRPGGRAARRATPPRHRDVLRLDPLGAAGGRPRRGPDGAAGRAAVRAARGAVRVRQPDLGDAAAGARPGARARPGVVAGLADLGRAVPAGARRRRSGRRRGRRGRRPGRRRPGEHPGHPGRPALARRPRRRPPRRLTAAAGRPQGRRRVVRALPRVGLAH
jgi:MFS family permease